MDRRLLTYYNRELQHIRESAVEFGKEFPKIAGRLGLDSSEVADPYVERLLEGFAYLSARIQVKLDAEFPRFTQGLLETVYPHYLAPTPSMAVVKFKPDLSEGALAQGVTIPRGAALRSRIGKGDQTACEYRTAHDVTLYPLEIVSVEYQTRGLAAFLAPTEPGDKAGLRIRLRCTAGMTFQKLNLDRLVFYLHGSDETPMRLYEAFFAHARAVSLQPLGNPVKWREVLPAFGHAGPGSPGGAINRVGYDEHHAALPHSPRSFHGYRLLQEYFTLPQRFMFVEVSGLKPAVSRSKDTELDLIILFNHAQPDLETALSAANVSMFCSPAINLFPRRADRIHLTDRFNEYQVIPDRTRPLDFEVFEVRAVTGYGETADVTQEFLPFYSASDLDHDGRGSGAYFTVNRVPRVLSEKEKKRGRRSESYSGSESYITLVDAHCAPYRTDLQQLGVETLCTNRDLPVNMPVGGGRSDFTMDAGAPVESIHCLTGPTPPKPSFAEGDTAWRVISHFALNYFSLTDSGDGPGPAGSRASSLAGAGGANALRDLLKLYADTSEAAIRKQVEGVRSIGSRPITRRVSAPGPIAFARGLEVAVTFDELPFEGVGIFVLGSVLEQFFARYVSINSFTETVIRSQARGEVMRWPARIGLRPML
ncbi:MAG: type VI secretion system baseplate subunit TssF [Phycisphaerales bacterium]